MPKRGNGRGRNWRGGENDHGHHHYEQDDRGNENTRRVSFKPGTNNKFKNKHNNRKWNEAIKRLDDIDVDMNATGSNLQRAGFRGGYRGREGRMNSPAPKYVQRVFQPGHSPWYQVTIPYGGKHDKDVVLKALLSNLSPDIFIPHYYKNIGNAAIFYVDDVIMAEKLFYVDRKITMPDGFKLNVKVRCGTPHINVDENLKEKMKLAMAKRYNPSTKALDLTKFHADPELLDVFCALYRPTIMVAAMDIVAENISDLEALNLNDNKLHALDHMKGLSSKLKKLKILYLGENRITHMHALDAFKGLPLVELFLTGNPLVSKIKDHDLYISDVRKKFPKLIKLDGADLPPKIGFDVSDEVNLPSCRASFLCNPQGQDLIREFLKQYYAIYDSDSRQPLLEAYHENAMLSISMNYGHYENRGVPSNRLNHYLSQNRNLNRLTDREGRRKLLKTGKLQVVSSLSDLPKTQHDLQTFSVDLTTFTPTFIAMTINGVFKETSVNITPKPLRSFHRTLIIVPNGSGFCIQNDLFFITNVTKEQDDASFKDPIIASTIVSPSVVPVQAPVQLALDEAAKLQMVQALAQQSGMNIQWSTNCLEQTNWDYQRGVFIFNELQKEGKIPPEAFIK